ncbi:Gfo/Idh/MocA family protein [Allokutzneria albata]|uniref:Predicted dehydrogenase n=1 Tax=Allokutzneria albata TaxID=211114 RepID=A0A1H0D053_ALLAB|nr:Gfo/Idh/MocA family oxidoreductase [Allokutzneria albata]SDN63524.1 Predicted dehydrogenase [Allokutzneria albata]
MSDLRIGILGAGRIAEKAVIAPARANGFEVAAIAARDHARAQDYARQHGIAKAHKDYMALVEDGSLDAVYVALPPSAHAEWSVTALRAGRNVLVEKPFAANATQAEAMVAAAGDRVLMEAFHYRYHPLTSRLIDLVAGLGAIRTIEAVSNVPIPDRSDIRHDPELAGGALMDLGCYPVHLIRTLTGAEPGVVRAEAVREVPGVDLAMAATLALPGGGTAAVRCSMAEGPEITLTVVGEHGRLHVTNPTLPQAGALISHDGGAPEPVDPLPTTFDCQLAAFAAALRGGAAPLTGGADATANMRVIDRIYQVSGMAPRG